MIKYLKDLFTVSAENDQNNIEDKHHKLEIAACALLIEIAKADDDFSSEEKDKISQIMRSKFNLSESEVNDILEISQESVKKSISLYEFTDVLVIWINMKTIISKRLVIIFTSTIRIVSPQNLK